MMDCKKSGRDKRRYGGRSNILVSATCRSGQEGWNAADGLYLQMSTETERAVLEVNSETDFVAKNEEFRSLSRRSQDRRGKSPADVDAPLGLNYPGTTSPLPMCSATAILVDREHQDTQVREDIRFESM